MVHQGKALSEEVGGAFVIDTYARHATGGALRTPRVDEVAFECSGIIGFYGCVNREILENLGSGILDDQFQMMTRIALGDRIVVVLNECLFDLKGRSRAISCYADKSRGLSFR